MSGEQKVRGRVFLVLGASGGIGSEVCRLLSSAGDRPVIAGRSSDRLAGLREELDCPAFEVDATEPDGVVDLAGQIVERFGRLDGIANCIGSLILKPAHLTSGAEWDETLKVNLGSAFSTVRAAASKMKDGGSVVLVSSAAARTGLSNHEAISAAKAGILGLMRSAAATYASRRLRFNAVAPGLVRTPMTARITANQAVADASQALHAAGRLGEPADVARMIAWLLDPHQSWVTGQVFGVDGGLATVRTQR